MGKKYEHQVLLMVHMLYRDFENDNAIARNIWVYILYIWDWQ